MPTHPEWFEQWFDSPYYHKLYFDRDEIEASDFINRLLDLLNPNPGSKMLDVACGKGRHSKILAARGFDVTGIDLSKRSIREAKRYETDILHFFQHDMRLPFWINYFDYAFNFFTSFGYFKSERENYNVIRTISGSLKPRGSFVLDYLNVHFSEDHLVHKAEKQVDGVNYILTKWFNESHFFKKIVIEDEALEEPLEFTEQVAKFSLGDFNDMFSFHNLQIQEVFGDYHFGKYDVKRSPRLIMIAKKTHNPGRE
jgi:SAM-dependent methyltransferase